MSAAMIFDGRDLTAVVELKNKTTDSAKMITSFGEVMTLPGRALYGGLVESRRQYKAGGPGLVADPGNQWSQAGVTW